MNISRWFRAVYLGILEFMPFFRVAWLVNVAVGIVLLVLAMVIKKNSERKKAPWIVGGIGLLMLVSSGIQLIASL